MTEAEEDAMESAWETLHVEADALEFLSKRLVANLRAEARVLERFLNANRLVNTMPEQGLPTDVLDPYDYDTPVTGGQLGDMRAMTDEEADAYEAIKERLFTKRSATCDTCKGKWDGPYPSCCPVCGGWR